MSFAQHLPLPGPSGTPVAPPAPTSPGSTPPAPATGDRGTPLDDVVRLAADACQASAAFLAHLVGDELVLLASFGLPPGGGVLGQPRSLLAALENGLASPGLLVDPLPPDDPLALPPVNARRLAAMPIGGADGQALALLCVLDPPPGPAEGTLPALGRLARLAARPLGAALEARLAPLVLPMPRQPDPILEGAHDHAIVGLDLDGRVTSWSEGAERILGWSGEDMLGRPASHLLTAEDVRNGQMSQEMEQALRDGHHGGERWHVRRDGSRFWGSTELMTLRQQDGAPRGFVRILRDSTALYRKGQTRQVVQDRIETALQTGLVAFFDRDLPRGAIRGDARYAAFFEQDPELAAAGIPIEEIVQAVHPDDRHLYLNGEKLDAAGEYSRHFRVRRRDGGVRHLYLRGRCYEFRDGQPIRSTGVVVDVSATRDAEEALRASEEFNRKILASSSDCICVLDLDGHLLFVNEGGLKALDADSSAALVGRRWADLLPEADRPAADAALAAACAGGIGRFASHAQTLKGRRRFWDNAITPVLDAVGHPERLLCISRDLTDMQRANERIQLALEAGAVLGTWVLDIATSRMSLDSRLSRMLGFGEDPAATGIALEAALAHVHPDDLPQVRAHLEEAVASGSSYRGEHRLRTSDGGWTWVETSGRCEQDGQGRPERLSAILLDIDRRKRHELRQAALIEFGDQLRGLTDPVDLMQLASAALGRVLEAQRAGFGRIEPSGGEFLRIEAEWRLQPGLPSLTGLYDFRRAGAYLDDLKRNEAIAIADVEGDPRTAEHASDFRAQGLRSLLGVPLFDNGRLEAVVLAHDAVPRIWSQDEIGFARAIADRAWSAVRQLRAEAELRRINDTLEATVARRTRERDRLWTLSPQLLVVTGFDGRYRSVNPAWTQSLGYAPAELVGLGFDRLAHPDDVQLVIDSFARLLAGELVKDLETRVRHRDGSWRTTLWTCIPQGDEIYAIGEDITDRRQLEEQLRQSQKMEAVGQLTGGIAHDFNNLLTGIGGSLELLALRLEEEQFDSLDAYVATAQEATRRAAALTHRLLAFSRRQTLDPRPTEVQGLIESMLELVQRTVGPDIAVSMTRDGEKEEMAADGEEDIWPILVDANQLENALLNLCINARDAMPQGGRLTIGLANEQLGAAAARELDLSPGDYVALSVRDTGTGMTPDVIARAYDPFFTTKPIGMGTGLGLSMTYGFARQSGGQVRIASRLGAGTGVTLYLPRHHARPKQETAVERPAAPRPDAAAGETILVIDDEETVRVLVVEVLQTLGYATLEAADGAAGLALLQEDRRIDLLVTDVGLPGGMNGRQVADAARRLRPELRTLFITGYAESSVLDGSGKDGSLHVLTKPFTMRQLASRVRSLLDA